MENVLSPDIFSLENELIDTSRHLVNNIKNMENIVKARIMINGEEYEKAILTLKEVLDDDPDNLEALNDITVAYILNGNSLTAMGTIYRVLELDQNNDIAIDNLNYLKARQ
jgi:Flp pilus assembly protein TadD